MEIALIADTCIRLKGKQTSLLVDPVDITVKTSADGIILLSPESKPELSKVEGQRIVINGDGEYEVGGVKVSGKTTDNECVYTIIMDSIQILLGKVSTVEKLQDKLEGSQVALLNANTGMKPGLLPALECSLAVLYGPQKDEAAKNAGKEFTKIVKIAVTADKLTAELSVVVLG